MVRLIVAIMLSFVCVVGNAYEYSSKCPIGDSRTYEGQTVSFPGGDIPGIGTDRFNYVRSQTANGSYVHWYELSYWVDHRGFAQCNCTSYAAEMSKIKWNDGLGNAENWNNRARTLGWPISTTVPVPGAVIQWDAGDGPAGSVGHVGSIAGIDFNGTEITGLRYTDWNARGDHNGPGDRSIASNNGDYASAHFIYTEFPEAGEYVSTDGSTKSICLHDYPKKNYSVCWEYATGGSDVCENARRNFVFQSDSKNGICYAPQAVGTNLCPPKETYVGRNLSGSPDVISYSSPTGAFSSVGGFGGGSVPMSGPGLETPATDEPIHNLPDFTVRKIWLETPWGVEAYKYGNSEIVKMKAQFKNIGNGNLPSESASIEVHFYLSRGYKEDPHSGNGAWKRVGTDFIKADNLRSGYTHTETEGIELRRDIPSPGIWNIVACIDHPRDDHNSGGDHQEKHESNNCSTEAVFEVTANPIENQDPRFVDFVTSGLHFRQAPYYAGDPARFGATVLNRGNVGSPANIRSSYSVECPGTGRIHLTSDDTQASTLSPGGSSFEETIAAVTLPNVAGTCTAYFCADYQGAVTESDEGNNCTSLSFTLQPRPAPRLVITKFQDETGCCTTNTGSRIKPDIWVRNDGPVAPGANVTVIYHISSPVATGGTWWHIGYGSIRPSELPPGGTDEDYMDNAWSIPKNSAWKNQWHTVRGCLKVDGSTPVGDPNTEVCSYYTRFSKK